MPMTLRPPSIKQTVFEVLRQLEFDVSDWLIGANGEPLENPAVNGRAYAWSYRNEPTDESVFMLWYEGMKPRSDGRYSYRDRWQGLVARLEVTRPITAKRADKFLRHVSDLEPGTVVRVAVVEGNRSNADDNEASRVLRRELDPEPWHLQEWDPLTGTFEFIRGLPDKSAFPAKPSGGDKETAEDDAAARVREDIEKVLSGPGTPTQKQRLIEARLGQGKFRSDLLKRWGHACAVTGTTTLAAIRASHSKPWHASMDDERLNPANGLPLIATLDALYDTGWITFDDDGTLWQHRDLSDPTLNLEGLKLRRALTEEEKGYVAYHRAKIFEKNLKPTSGVR